MANFDSLHPTFKDRLGRMMADLGLGLTSGYRSSDEQAYLYSCYVNCSCNGCNPANPAGSSNHEAEPYGCPAGLAADLHGNLSAAHERAHEYGIHFPIRSVEPWHAQPVEVPYAYFTGFPEGWSCEGSLPGGRYTVSRGTRGAMVAELQNRLTAHGFAVEADGDFGPATENAVIAFQNARGLAADGIVGENTWAALDAAPEPAEGPQTTTSSAGRRPASELRLSSQGAALIAQFEGVVLRLYDDPAGHCTVGIGHLVHHGACNGDSSEGRWAGRELSAEEAYRLFIEEDAPRYEQAVKDRIRVPLYQSEYDALVSFAYNLGGGALDENDSTLARKLNAGDYEGASLEFGRWVNAGGRRLEGLVRRRAAEAELFRAEWNASPAPTPSPAGHPGWPGRYLRESMSGEDVRQAQAKLAERGWRLDVDGSYGPQTVGVVLAFQGEKGLVVDGTIGPDTWEAMFTAPVTGGAPVAAPSFPAWPGRYLRRGDSGSDVAVLQGRLLERGWGWIGSADGDFGAKTERAISQFQAEKGLTVDGIVGPSTWNALWNAPL